MQDYLYVILGIALLMVGGEGLIRGALGIANRFKVSPLICGLVILGFGTSAPELFLTLDAAMSNQPDAAIGNVVGSNIGNILIILGVCAVIRPLTCPALIFKRDASSVVLSCLVFSILIFDGLISLIDGFIYLGLLAGYVTWAIRSENNPHVLPAPNISTEELEPNDIVKPRSTMMCSIFVIAGLALLLLGSNYLLEGAVNIAKSWGLSNAVISLTILAVGTSMPELTISIIATIKRQSDVAVASILGSNVFNILGILGVTAFVTPLNIADRISSFDQWVMLAVSMLLFVFLYTGKRLSRIEGLILLAVYALYVWYSFQPV
jgi:cation:H+ antiporter